MRCPHRGHHEFVIGATKFDSAVKHPVKAVRLPVCLASGICVGATPPLIHGGSMAQQQTRWAQFGVLITVFFFWGFVAASNDILIPVFKKAFHLSQSQSQLVAVAFYVAYTVGSLIYFGISKLAGQDLLNKIGYKNGICVGLLI